MCGPRRTARSAASTSPPSRSRAWWIGWWPRSSAGGRSGWRGRSRGSSSRGCCAAVDGASVYTVAGADLYTSARVLDAEQRLVAAAGRRDGHAVPGVCVDLALVESHANGLALTGGQAVLVREMATSGARLQLAIAPAGAGKTTAMRALAAAWVEDGGTVVGLAPSAAAAAVLRGQVAADTDTLAKLTWALHTGDLPDWAARIGPSTLVIVDEAGMADTLSLDTDRRLRPRPRGQRPADRR